MTTPREDWEKVKAEWEKHPALERVIAMESFVQNHGWGGYGGEIISEFWLSKLDEAYKKGREDAVEYILANWNMLGGETDDAVRKNVARHAGDN